MKQKRKEWSLYMMNYVWAGIMLVSIICAMATGRVNEVTTAMFSGAGSAVTLVISLAGAMCLWSGLMKIADRAGLTKKLAKSFSPIMHLLFPGLEPDSDAAKAISMNVSANLLGMGNAATPFGIAAMKELAKRSGNPETATDDMVTFVVMNTASIQLIPTTIAMMRASAGSTTPFDLMPAIWITSVSALFVGILMTRIFNGFSNVRLYQRRRTG